MEQQLKNSIQEFIIQLMHYKVKRIQKQVGNYLCHFEPDSPSKYLTIVADEELSSYKTIKHQSIFDLIQTTSNVIEYAELYTGTNQYNRIMFIKQFIIDGKEKYLVFNFCKKDDDFFKKRFDPLWYIHVKNTLKEAKNKMSVSEGYLKMNFSLKLSYSLENFKHAIVPVNTKSTFAMDTLTPAELKKMTVVQLKSLAKEKNINNIGKLKADIIKAILHANI